MDSVELSSSSFSFTPVQFALGRDVTIQLLGNINLPDNITEVQAGVTGKNYRSAWFSVTSTGPGISLVGPKTARDRLTGGIIRSYGQVCKRLSLVTAVFNHPQPWWDAFQQTSRPLLFAWRAKCAAFQILSLILISKNSRSSGTIQDLTILKPIGKSFNIAGSGNMIQNIFIDAISDTSAFPFNT